MGGIGGVPLIAYCCVPGSSVGRRLQEWGSSFLALGVPCRIKGENCWPPGRAGAYLPEALSGSRGPPVLLTPWSAPHQAGSHSNSFKAKCRMANSCTPVFPLPGSPHEARSKLGWGPLLLFLVGCVFFLLLLPALRQRLPLPAQVIFIFSPSAIYTVYIFCLFCLRPLSIHSSPAPSVGSIGIPRAPRLPAF